MISVVTPVYNGGEFIAECIESVLNQTFTDFEYIILNNASSDETSKIANYYARKDSRIRVECNETTIPVIANHNKAFGLISTQSKYCKVVSADDYIFPMCIEKMVAVAERNTTAGIVGSYQASGTVIKWQGFPFGQELMRGRDVCRQQLLQEQVFVEREIPRHGSFLERFTGEPHIVRQPILGFGTPTSLLYRSELVRQPNFYPNPSPHSDTSACLASLKDWDFGFVHEILSYERTHDNTQTSASIKLNRYSSQSISDLKTYGPYYLDEGELRREIGKAVRGYHRFLLKNSFRKDEGFWSYHKKQLSELGYPLTVSSALRAMRRG